MQKTRFAASLLTLLAAPAALAGTVPLGVPAGGRLGLTVGQLVGAQVGEFLTLAVPGLLGVAAGALALGICIVRRKRR